MKGQDDAVAVLGRAQLKSGISSARTTSTMAIAVSTRVRSCIGRSGRWRGCASRGGRAGRAGDCLLLGEDCVDQFHRSVSVGNQRFSQPRPHGPDGFEFPAGAGS